MGIRRCFQSVEIDVEVPGIVNPDTGESIYVKRDRVCQLAYGHKGDHTHGVPQTPVWNLLIGMPSIYPPEIVSQKKQIYQL